MPPRALFAAPARAVVPEAELAYLAATLPERAVEADTLLLREGEPGDRCFVILAGTFDVIKALGTADERRLGERGAGEVVGEMSLVDSDQLRSASVRTRTAARLLELPRTTFTTLLAQRPVLAQHFLRLLTARLRESDDATIRDLSDRNRRLEQALAELHAAQARLVEQQVLERELQLAREIQESMLPSSFPDVLGFHFGARMVPAQAVGGDFFDFFALGNDRVGVLIGDVSGKGMPAALFMALTRSLVRAEAIRATDPGTALRAVNRHLRAMNAADMFVTVLYGVLDGRSGGFRYARAGHELPLLVNGNGQVMPAAMSHGQALAVLADPVLDEQELVIPPYGALLLVTDGATDAVSEQGEFFGAERLAAALCTSAAAGQALVDGVLQTILEYQGAAARHDDITLVTVTPERRA